MKLHYEVGLQAVELCLELDGEVQREPMEGVDRLTFVDLGHGWARDAEGAIYNGERHDADSASLRVFSERFANDREQVFHLGDVLQGDDDLEIDVATFRPLGDRYFCDAKAVFCTRYGYDCYETARVEGATPSGFEGLDSTFGRQGSVLFSSGRVEAQVADATRFRLIHRYFAVDGERVYHLAFGGKHSDEVVLRPINGADPATFSVLSEGYASDRARVYFFLNDPGDSALAELHVLEGVGPADFEVLPGLGPDAGRDRRRGLIFIHGEVEAGIADPATFEVLGDGTARDRLTQYTLVEEPRTFRGVQTYGAAVVVPRPVR